MSELLSEIELRGAVWTKLKAHYEDRLAELRRKNDGDLTPEQTYRLRGQIAEVKKFLATGDKQQKIEPEPFVE